MLYFREKIPSKEAVPKVTSTIPSVSELCTDVHAHAHTQSVKSHNLLRVFQERIT